jgi:hypothetical protein
MNENELPDQIGETIRKMLYPSPFAHWMEGLTQAERVGRIKRSKMSTLRYGLRQFLMTQISASTRAYESHTLQITPMDDEVQIWLHNENDDITLGIAYPFWLQDFLTEDENFALLLPDCEEKIAEVLQRIHEWCLANSPYDLLVR